jgi:hypothetical protein
MPYWNQVQGDQIGPYKLATSDSYAEANSIVFSTPCFQQIIHPTSEAYQNIMNPSSPTCSIILTPVFFVAIIIVLPGSAWSLTQDIIPGNCDLHTGLLIAEFVLAQMISPRSHFSIKGLEEPQFYLFQ